MNISLVYAMILFLVPPLTGGLCQAAVSTMEDVVEFVDV